MVLRSAQNSGISKPGEPVVCTPDSRGSGKKKEPKPKLLVRICSGGMGVFHRKGWGPKSLVCPSKPRETKLFGGISRDFAGISRGCPKSLRKKVCVQFSSPSGFCHIRGFRVSAFPELNPLACGCLSCLCRFWYFRDSLRCRKHPVANHRLGKA